MMPCRSRLIIRSRERCFCSPLGTRGLSSLGGMVSPTFQVSDNYVKGKQETFDPARPGFSSHVKANASAPIDTVRDVATQRVVIFSTWSAHRSSASRFSSTYA